MAEKRPKPPKKPKQPKSGQATESKLLKLFFGKGGGK